MSSHGPGAGPARACAVGFRGVEHGLGKTSFEAAQRFGFGVSGGETFAVVVATGAIDATPACIAKRASDRNLCVGALVG